ncbi:MAG TPA: NUDIX hydrolase [bacterium]|jgi:8-oxo-dGTP diphosphatase|nr:NUDIX hydrolase [bacterium]
MKRYYPTRPLVGVGAVIIRDHHILLIKRGRPPAQGCWSVPGGTVELGETLAEAVSREVKEECNLDTEVGPPIAVLDSIVHDDQQQIMFHYTLVDFWVNSIRGRLECSSDAKEVQWVPLATVPTLQLTQGLVGLLDHIGCTQGQAPAQPPVGIFYYSQLNRR